MAVGVAVSAAFAKALLRRNIIKVMVDPSKGILSQAKVVDSHDDMHGDHDDAEIEARKVQLQCEKIHINTGKDALKVNLEFASKATQRDLIDQLGPKLNAIAIADDKQIPIVRFNYLTEDIFINKLRKDFRTLGYNGTFTRYNHDKGMATFELMAKQRGEEGFVLKRYSYYRSGQPNLC